MISGAQSGSQCPTGFSYYGNKCYYFGSASVNWYSARDICKTRGGVLATINSADEQVRLILFFHTFHSDILSKVFSQEDIEDNILTS